MGMILLVASRTVGGPELEVCVRSRVAAGRQDFFLFVPQRPPAATSVAAGLATIESIALLPPITEMNDSMAEEADARLAGGIAWLESLGARAQGVTGPAETVGSVGDIVNNNEIDEIIVSTLPSRLSKWLRQDLPSRIRRRVGDVELTVIVAEDLPADSAADDRIILANVERLMGAAGNAKADIAHLFHDEFVAIGPDGLVRVKAAAVHDLTTRKASLNDPTGMEVTRVDADTALVTYGVATDGPVLRSSLWVRTDGQWQLRFHQATPVTHDGVS